jgi:drug/metabolite transporter (DMT)-like permease
MPLEAIAAALLSAVIHASWNAVLKAGRDRLTETVFVTLGWALLAIPLILWKGPLPAAAWPYAIASAAVHLLYWMALMEGYAAGDLSHVYTLSRGAAPALVAVGGTLAAREIPSGLDAAGIGLVCLGIACVGFSPQAPLRATAWGLLTALCIAGYSLVDALGARITGDAPRYTGWMFLADAIPICAYAFWRRGIAVVRMASGASWRRGIAAGLVSALGFGIVLWAQMRAPIAQVTALRETSVVFAALIGWLLLKERLGPRRWAGALIVAAGALLLALA